MITKLGIFVAVALLLLNAVLYARLFGLWSSVPWLAAAILVAILIKPEEW